MASKYIGKGLPLYRASNVYYYSLSACIDIDREWEGYRQLSLQFLHINSFECSYFSLRIA